MSTIKVERISPPPAPQPPVRFRIELSLEQVRDLELLFSNIQGEPHGTVRETTNELSGLLARHLQIDQPHHSFRRLVGLELGGTKTSGSTRRG